VIKVRNRDDDTQLGTKLEQHPQQRDRIRAARHGNADAVARAHQLSFPDVAKHLFAHEEMVMQVEAFSYQPLAI
jgi:hypothetical protein